jgi:hypothetical protein
MDTIKTQKAIEIIAAEIAKLPANTIMDHGTLGNGRGLTKREGVAHDMAKTFVTMLTKIDFGGLPQNWSPDQDAAYESVKDIAAAAVANVGK